LKGASTGIVYFFLCYQLHYYYHLFFRQLADTSAAVILFTIVYESEKLQLFTVGLEAEFNWFIG
jgi:hypothetical protein